MDELDRLSQEYDQIEALGGEYDAMEAEKPKKKVGWAGVAEDLRESLSSLPSMFAEMLPALGSELGGIGSQAVNEPSRLGLNALSGIPQLGANVLNTPGNIRDYLAQKELVPQDAPSFRLPESVLPRDYNYAEALGVQGQQPGDVLTQGLVSNLPFAAAGELGALRALPRMGARAGAQGAAAVGQNQNPAQAALASLGIEGAGRLIGKGAGKLAPSNVFRGSLSPEELARNAEVAAGTNTPLGSVLESPTLKQLFENVSTKVPLGGGDTALGNIGNQVTQRAEDIVNKTGNIASTGDLDIAVKSGLVKAFDQQTKKKNALYRPIEDMATEEGFKLDLNKFGKKVKEKGGIIENSPLMQGDSKFSSAYKKMAGAYAPKVKDQSDKIVNARGLIEPEYQVPTLKEANLVKNRLNKIANDYAKSPETADRHLASQFGDLAKSLSIDIKKSIAEKGSPRLQKAFNDANENYRKNFAPFLDKDTYKLLSPEKDADAIIQQIIQPGKAKDKAARIKRITNLLPEEDKGILGHAYLRSAFDKEGVLDPKKLASLIDKLGDRQFKALFPDEAIRKELLNYGKLRGMNERALTFMANPLTGQQLALPSALAAQGAMAGGLLLSGRPLSALGAAVGPQSVSKLFNMYATSPNVREGMVKKMIERSRGEHKKPKTSTKKAATRQAGLAALIDKTQE
jgi:hypothetical protein